VLRVALGQEYRGRRVHQGPVVYCCFEGQSGIQARAEAFRQRFLPEQADDVPFLLQPVTMDLVKEHGDLISAVRNFGQNSGGRRARHAQQKPQRLRIQR
jgi:hypothetical protein